MKTTLTVELPLPPKVLFKNAPRAASKIGAMAYNREKSKARGWAKMGALAALSKLGDIGLPWVSAVIKATYHFEDHGKTLGKHDAHNLHVPNAPYLDGLQDALGLNDREFQVMPIRVKYGEGRPGVVFEIRGEPKTHDAEQLI